MSAGRVTTQIQGGLGVHPDLTNESVSITLLKGVLHILIYSKHEIVECKFNNKPIACVVVDGNPWFRGKDIATLLDYADTKKAIAKHVSEDDRKKMEELMGVWETPWTTMPKMQYL